MITMVASSFLVPKISLVPSSVLFRRYPNMQQRRQQQQHKQRNELCRQWMGLYDKPLPPRPPPRNDKKKNGPNNSNKEGEDDDDDEEEDIPPSILPPSPRLFAFDPTTGEEVNDLLPPLGRTLTSGVDCYFEATDRLVLNLVDKTSCSVEDACWALEACQGDITEAWTRISTARRLQLNANRLPSKNQQQSSLDNDEEDDNGDWDEDSYDVAMQEEYERLKAQRKEQERKRNVQDFFKGGEADQNWLPKSNPRPMDDEPWFTG